MEEGSGVSVTVEGSRGAPMALAGWRPWLTIAGMRGQGLSKMSLRIKESFENSLES